jgi:hypothetical protein
MYLFLLTLLDVVAWVEADAGLTCGKLEGTACYSGVVSAASIVRKNVVCSGCIQFQI